MTSGSLTQYFLLLLYCNLLQDYMYNITFSVNNPSIFQIIFQEN